MEMYVWEVRLEIEWETNWKEGTAKKNEKWTDTQTYTVASPTGFGAIEKAKKLALENSEPFDNSEERENNEPIKTSRATGIVDVYGLDLKETLDG